MSNPAQVREWDSYVLAHPEGTVFHTTYWIRTLQETYSFNPLLGASRDCGGSLTAILPFIVIKNLVSGCRLLSLPFSDFCGPLFSGGGPDESLIESLIRDPEYDCSSMEIRSSLKSSNGFQVDNQFKRHTLTLDPDPVSVLNRVDKRTIRYSIRKSKKAGVRIVEDNSLSGMKEFYRLNMLTRKKHGVPSQPYKLFESILRNFVSAGAMKILLAYYGDVVVAGGVFFSFKDTIYYKYSASDPKYIISVTPNHLLTWTAIENACVEGKRFFDFGRTSSDNIGLMRYKEMWGAMPSDLPYLYFPHKKGPVYTTESSFIYKTLTGLWRHMPASVAEILGPRIYKYMA
jgi:CelD/BcsL family acetyltransferase involved in cellulose biosynthesis